MSTVVMVRTDCCETYKCSGERCSNCPERSDNHALVEQCKAQPPVSFGRRLRSAIASGFLTSTPRP